MKQQANVRTSERGSAGAKFLAIFVVLFLVAHAGYQYVPVAYAGANFRQEMDTAVVKGLATSGRLKPVEVVQASINRAMYENDIPATAIIEIKPEGAVVMAHVVYSKDVNILPFGLYKYRYDFNHRATPQGYLLK